MACLFFSPTERFEGITVPHRTRLPLGEGWRGVCTAPAHENSEPDALRLAECCNIGYASKCSWLPRERSSDAVRFSVARDREDSIHLFYVCEVQHRPGAHGMLEFDCARSSWRSTHPDARIQRLAEAYLEVYLTRRSHGAEGRA